MGLSSVETAPCIRLALRPQVPPTPYTFTFNPRRGIIRVALKTVCSPGRQRLKLPAPTLLEKTNRMFRALKQRATFIKQFTTRFETTGSLVPSSRFLAKSITRYLRERAESPIRVLECGPGTGAFTNRIVRLLQPGDTYHLVELNERFVQTLKRRFEEEPHWQAVAKTAQIFETPLQEFQPAEKYDFIISGLPHVNFPPALLEQMTATYVRMLKPGGMFSYFEYMCVLRIRKSISLFGARQRMRKVNSILQDFCNKYRIGRDSVWMNFPPAWVQHLNSPGDD